ncbi:Plasmodium exported protein, unknown function [Plasmodium berghei]|uniref:Uncharacterized protein n=1 Tax=Plasmodium berghei TaxID=5821 RepID=A0A113QU77_PLABE|nr:Plasmodium exported protein, unknown function [Plasmodium berghei]
MQHSEEDEQIEVKHVEQPEQVEVEHVEEDKKEEEKKIIMSMKGEASSLYEIFSHMVMDLSLIMNPNKVSDDELIRIFKDYQDNLNRKYNLGFDTMDKLEKEGNGGIVEPSNNDVELKENANDFLKDTLEISKESGKEDDVPSLMYTRKFTKNSSGYDIQQIKENSTDEDSKKIKGYAMGMGFRGMINYYRSLAFQKLKELITLAANKFKDSVKTLYDRFKTTKVFEYIDKHIQRVETIKINAVAYLDMIGINTKNIKKGLKITKKIILKIAELTLEALRPIYDLAKRRVKYYGIDHHIKELAEYIKEELSFSIALYTGLSVIGYLLFNSIYASLLSSLIIILFIPYVLERMPRNA